jgi:Xaa-Pro aminopeptidase
MWSAPVQTYSNDVDYEFRQDSNLYYLTGIDQPETILVLMPGNQERKEILFVKPKDPVREHWEGSFLSKDDATNESGIRNVHLTTEFESFMNAILAGSPYGAQVSEYERFFTARREGRAKVQLMLSPRPGLSGPLGPTYEFAKKIRERFFGFSVVDATPVLNDMRQIKSALEMKTLEESANVSSEAHMAGMRAAKPGAWEYEVEAAIEHVYKSRGAFDWGYPSIVGSGPNATILHYEKSSRQMKDGDLLLVDAAAHYKYMTVDITRTYPVNGKFSPAQREIYELVLAAQEAGMKAAVAGATFADIGKKAADVVKEGLLKLGLITDAKGDQYRVWYTHGPTHWIGMDVHDVGPNSRPLAAGVAFVIEPGLYIREQALDQLPKTAENAAFIEKVRPVVQKYKDIGVRIEDSFLLTESGLKRLSAKVPRTVAEIEAYLKKN